MAQTKKTTGTTSAAKAPAQKAPATAAKTPAKTTTETPVKNVKKECFFLHSLRL